jgi:amino-acid N-acetyltransferase
MERLKTEPPTSSQAPLPELPIQTATLDDVAGIHKLLKHFSDRGILLPRPESDIYHSLREFQVVKLGEKIIACCALQIFTRNLGEVRSLAVAPEYSGFGLGKRLVFSTEQEALRIGLGKLMALTYEVQFFNRLGFDVVEMNVLPEKVWGACINCHKFRNCDEIAVLKILPS